MVAIHAQRSVIAAILLCLVAVTSAGAQSTAQDAPEDAGTASTAPVVGAIFQSTAAPAAQAAAAPSFAPDSTLPATMDRGLLVDRRGMTLYTYDGDRRPLVSTCYGLCQTLWPPLYATLDDEPQGDYRIVHRRDGSLQWAFRGKPLYFWRRDGKPGDVTGDGVNKVWHVVRDSAPVAR